MFSEKKLFVLSFKHGYDGHVFSLSPLMSKGPFTQDAAVANV